MGFLGPVGIKIPLVIDRAIAAMATVVVGGNAVDVHLKGVVPGRDFPLEQVHDVRNADAGDPCPRCGKPLQITAGPGDRPRLQAGHQVFQVDGSDLPRREGERSPRHHGLLRDRHQPDRRRRGRGRPRRQRNPLAAGAGTLSRRGRPAPGAKRGRDGAGRRPREGADGGRASTSWPTTATRGRA